MKYEKYRPDVRETALEHGISFMFDEELVMLILGTGTSQMPVEIMAEEIIEIAHFT